LWIVTRGAQQADPGDRALSPHQAAAWGLAKTVALEHPELDCVCIDLDGEVTQGEQAGGIALALAAELAEAGGETQVALRQGSRRIARLARLPRLQNPPAAADPAAGSAAWRLA